LQAPRNWEKCSALAGTSPKTTAARSGDSL
jgi:hypothetical protein